MASASARAFVSAAARGLDRREKRYRSEPVEGEHQEEDAGEDGCVDGNASTIHA